MSKLTTDIDLDVNILEKLEANSLLKVKPELWSEWDFDKNYELGLDILEVSYGSDKKVWWKCGSCNSSYNQKIQLKTITNAKCPYCTGRRVNETNSLQSLNPELAKEWHPSKNDDLTPDKVTCNSHKKVWWKCSLGHSFDMRVDYRHRGKGCSYCKGNHRILIGFNDMWTTNPELAKQLANPEDGYKYMQSSGKKVDWKCSYCNKIIRNKCIRDIHRNGLNCEICSDKFNYPEKLMSSFLQFLGIEFISQKTFPWSKRKIYDFYIPKYNMIIETHGEQHYKQSKGVFKTRTLKEEQDNDKHKENLAIKNGIKNYIVINCSRSHLSFIKDNINKSFLASIFNMENLDWSYIELEARKSKHIEVLNLWKSGMTIAEIATKTKYTKTTVRQVLHKFTSIELCDYGLPKVIIQKDLDGNFVKEWNSIEDIKIDGKFDKTAIIRICNGRRSSHKGYYWEYKKYSIIGSEK